MFSRLRAFCASDLLARGDYLERESAAAMRSSEAFACVAELDDEAEDDEAVPMPPPAATVATSTVQQGETAATYIIERPANIARFVTLCCCCNQPLA